MSLPSPASLSHGNALQRSYYRWALPHYARMAPDLREQVEAVDRFLYTRPGLGFWVGWVCGLGGLCTGLRAAGLPLVAALAAGLALWLILSLAMLSAWLKPDAFTRARQWRTLALLALLLAAGALAGFAVGHLVRHGSLDAAALLDTLQRSQGRLWPAVGGTALGMGLLLWGLAQASRQVTQRRLALSRLAAERDAAARSAAESELRLLQGQIQPHFIFNTLATLQHWVDKRDVRSGPLLRDLTAFLRHGTEMLGRPTVPLAEEAQAVQHYLGVMQARLGPRLDSHVQLDPATAAQPLPPGLLLTLVENAIEHGLEPVIGGGRLWVTSGAAADGWWLRVDDDGAGLASTATDGVGLANLRRRLHHTWGAAARFSLTPRAGGGTRAEIHVDGPPVAAAPAAPPMPGARP
ncbi:MAG: sensor histidine kinase [Aquabacterium sp.]